MTNNATKFVLGLAVVGLIAGVVAVDDKAAMILLVGLFLAACALAYGLGRTVGPDLAPKTDDAATSIDPADVPRSSYGPVITAIGATVIASGGAMGPRYAIAGIAVTLVGAGVWLFDTFRLPGVIDRHVAENVDNRLLGPIALPVGAFVLAITIAYSLSRVLLAVSETASWVLAFIVAAVLLVILWAIADRVPNTRVVGALAIVGLVGVLVAGGAGAGAGEREFHHHEHEFPVVEIAARDTQFDRNIIAVPAETTIEMLFENYDIGVFHNVGIYQGDPGTPIFNGRPIAKGGDLYRFKTPAPGTYRYICDFHPTMVGELRVVEGAPTKGGHGDDGVDEDKGGEDHDTEAEHDKEEGSH